MLSDEQVSLLANAIKDDIKQYVETHPQEYMLFLQTHCREELSDSKSVDKP